MSRRGRSEPISPPIHDREQAREIVETYLRETGRYDSPGIPSPEASALGIVGALGIGQPDSLDLKDVVIEAYDPRPRGGQHVVKVASGVRVTHKPSGISVVADSEKSQLRNKELALNDLRTRLERHDAWKQRAEKAETVLHASTDEKLALQFALERAEERLRAVEALGHEIVEAYWPEFAAALHGLSDEVAKKYLDAPIARLRAVLPVGQEEAS